MNCHGMKRISIRQLDKELKRINKRDKGGKNGKEIQT